MHTACSVNRMHGSGMKLVLQLHVHEPVLQLCPQLHSQRAAAVHH